MPGERSGRFIAFEGGEGTGKSTQAGLLSQALEHAGEAVLLTREPGGTPGGEIIRGLLLGERGERVAPPPWSGVTEVLLHYAARREHLEKVLLPALAEGRWVISDRFAHSTMAYQGYGRGVDRDVIQRIADAVLGTFSPDLTILLDLPADAGLARARARGGRADAYERLDLAFHERIRDGFLALARREPERCVVIDATAPIPAVARAVRAAVRDRLGPRLET